MVVVKVVLKVVVILRVLEVGKLKVKLLVIYVYLHLLLINVLGYAKFVVSSPFLKGRPRFADARGSALLAPRLAPCPLAPPLPLAPWLAPARPQNPSAGGRGASHGARGKRTREAGVIIAECLTGVQCADMS
jgi:hypothetical protein